MNDERLPCWALDRIEEPYAPYHDWSPEDVPVMAASVEGRVEGQTLVFHRQGRTVLSVRRTHALESLVGMVRAERGWSAAAMAAALGVAVDRILPPLRELERHDVIQTDVARRCLTGCPDDELPGPAPGPAASALSPPRFGAPEAHGPPSAPASRPDLARPLRVFDDVLPRDLLTSLQWLSKVLPSRSVSFWSDVEHTAPALMDHVRHYLWPLCPGAGTPVVGFEWWVRRTPAYAFQHWHVDKDEALFMRTGEIRCPVFGSVLYLGDGGGPTILSDQESSADGKALVPPAVRKAWTVEPRANRFIVFPGTWAHAVLPDLRKRPGERASLPINWWSSRIESRDRLSTTLGACPELEERLRRLPPISRAATSPRPAPATEWAADTLPRAIAQVWTLG